MKLLGSTLLALSQASHFRAGTFQFTPDNTNIDIKRTHAWRRTKDGYQADGGCNSNHVANQVLSDDVGIETCTTNSGTNCGNINANYIVTDIEDTVSLANQYCYGYNDAEFAKPNEGYTYAYEGCCWVDFTDDQGGVHSSKAYKLHATINDVDNVSPDVKLPPIWYIMSGCGAQTIDLNPSDADGDTVRCRWSNTNEAAGGEYDGSLYPSLTLDPNTCIVTYDGTVDTTQTGVKPIAIHVEDFDLNGNVKSAIPVQFLATVWTPGIHPKSQGSSPYPDWFGEETEQDELIEELLNDGYQQRQMSRGRRAEPSYCTEVPIWNNVTPNGGSTLQAWGGAISFTVRAESQLSTINSISFSKPIGMTCSAVNGNGEATCTWQATAQQQLTKNHQVCYQANDALGLQTDYRCITIRMEEATTTTTTTTTTTPKFQVTDIFTMASERLTGFDMQGNPTFTAVDLQDYGCSGRGNMDPYAHTLGRPVDEADKAIFKWKKCIQCAVANYEPRKIYNYDEDLDECDDMNGTIERAVCECDRGFINTLNVLTPINSHRNYDGSLCVPSGKAGNGHCCENNFTGYFAFYNANTYCCNGSGQVRPIGQC